MLWLKMMFACLVRISMVLSRTWNLMFPFSSLRFLASPINPLIITIITKEIETNWPRISSICSRLLYLWRACCHSNQSEKSSFLVFIFTTTKCMFTHCQYQCGICLSSSSSSNLIFLSNQLCSHPPCQRLSPNCFN